MYQTINSSAVDSVGVPYCGTTTGADRIRGSKPRRSKTVTVRVKNEHHTRSGFDQADQEHAGSGRQRPEQNSASEETRSEL